MAERKYIHKNIRILLESGFTADELRQFCTEEPMFRPVSNRLAPNSGKYEIIEKILEHADLRLRFDTLLTWAEENNPVRFNRHKPYWEDKEGSAISSQSSGEGISQKLDEVKSGKILLDGQKVSGGVVIGELAETKEPGPGKSDSTGDMQKQVFIYHPLNWFKDNKNLTLVVSILLILMVASYFWLNSLPSGVAPTQDVPLTDEGTLRPTPPTITKEVPATDDSTPQSATPTEEVPATDDSAPQPVNDLASNIIDEFGVPMVLVPAGPFEMGSDKGEANEKPVHTVILDAFYIDQYEVTNASYIICTTEGKCSQPTKISTRTRNRYYDNQRYENYPVVNVNWEQANVYCNWRGGHLPTEAEWEKASRGTDGRRYPWGSGAGLRCDKANYRSVEGFCKGDTMAVGSYPDGISPYQVYEMSDNVREWVKDWFGENYYQNSPSENPQGPASGIFRVVRGGSWESNITDIRSTVRGFEQTDVTAYDLGFRCAGSP